MNPRFATVEARRAEAQRLRAQGLRHREIAAILGYRHATSVARLLYPDRNAGYVRRSNSKRSAAKRAWAREHDRGQCPCGATTGIGTARGGYRLCIECEREVRRVGQAMRDERIAELWSEGRTRPEIAVELDSSTSSIGVAMARMRKHGWDLPLRRDWTPEGLERARTARLAA